MLVGNLKFIQGLDEEELQVFKEAALKSTEVELVEWDKCVEEAKNIAQNKLKITNKHMRMGFLEDKLNKKKLTILNAIIEIIIIAFALIVMVYGGISITSLSMTQKTASLGIPMGYVYIVIPIKGVVIAVYGVLNVICLIRKGEEA